MVGWRGIGVSSQGVFQVISPLRGSCTNKNEMVLRAIFVFSLLTDYVCLLGGSYEPGIVAKFSGLVFGAQNVFRETARDGYQMIGFFDVCLDQSGKTITQSSAP